MTANVRGGAFLASAFNNRWVYRPSLTAEMGFRGVGFRIVRLRTALELLGQTNETTETTS